MGAVAQQHPFWSPRNLYQSSLSVSPVPVGGRGWCRCLGSPGVEGAGRGRLVDTLQSLLSAQQCGPSTHCEMDCEVNNEVGAPWTSHPPLPPATPRPSPP